MELDELQKIWNADREALHARLAVNEEALRDVMLERVRPRIGWSIGRRIVGLGFDVAILGALLAFIVANADAPRFIACALLIVGFVGITAVRSLEGLLGLLRLDLAGDIAQSQRILSGVALAEYRVFKWIALTAVLLWVPILAVALRALTGLDLFALASTAWVVGNLVLGAVIAIFGQWLSARYVERHDLSPRAQRFIDFAAGTTVRRVNTFVQQLGRFEA